MSGRHEQWTGKVVDIMLTKLSGANAVGRVAILIATVAITPLPIMARSVQHMYVRGDAERGGGVMSVEQLASSGSVHIEAFAAQTLTVAVAQTASNETTTPEAMAVHMIEFVADAAARGARVVVFPEMAVSLSPPVKRLFLALCSPCCVGRLFDC